MEKKGVRQEYLLSSSKQNKTTIQYRRSEILAAVLFLFLDLFSKNKSSFGLYFFKFLAKEAQP